jgi:DNA repair ATPase RecN
LKRKSQEKAQRLDFLKFQFQEYANLELDLDQDLNLEQEIKT